MDKKKYKNKNWVQIHNEENPKSEGVIFLQYKLGFDTDKDTVQHFSLSTQMNNQIEQK